MRRLMIVCCVTLAALVLAACGTVNSGGGGIFTPPISTGTDQSVVSSVQSAATKICGFVPAATTVIDIVATFTGGGAIADLIGRAASGICSAVTSKGARRGVTPKYRGVVIRGEFARR